ncbi:MAG: peptidase dimerization domain-containing protein, partial [Dehalococcoidales bacterium]|nr:peptidase dimerization domain-containing protein [Dehalococcoidales bacterium]
VNIGTIHGGLKMNMIPGDCVIECDIRLPVGADRALIMEEVEEIVKRYPEASVEELGYYPPNWCDPYGEMVRYIQTNARVLKGFEPPSIVSLFGTDCRLWRYRNIPAYVYGPASTGMASADEYVDIEMFLHIVRTHALSAYDYMTKIQ